MRPWSRAVSAQVLEDVGVSRGRAPSDGFRVDENGRASTLLHAATDWPGFFPNGPEVVAVLIDAGADPNAPIEGRTPLDDAVGYGCWQVARLLVERGARVDRLWHAAALGMISRAEELIATEAPTEQDLTDAFWQACHGGQRRMAERLLALGAHLNGTPSWGGGTPLDAAESVDTGREALVNWLREQGATESS
jgi:uncharacterized protein